MEANIFRKKIARLSGLCLIIAAVSCTYDYFEDETNFWVYVPQIERSEISNFYISIHSTDGRHVLTRQEETPFDRDVMMRRGILRFKLAPGNYRVSCFADYTRNAITEGNPLETSYMRQPDDDTERGTYRATASMPRVLFMNNVAAYPLEHPEAKSPPEADIDASRIFKGRIVCNFKDLPSAIDRVDIFYRGVATKYRFDGVFDRFTTDDVVHGQFNTADCLSNGAVSCSSLVYPSAGTSFGADTQYADNGLNVGLQIRFMQGFDTAGTASFDFVDLASLPPANRPTDAWGNPVTDLILYPLQTIIFNFSGFTLVGVNLETWDNIDIGGVDM
jgi:hypothetical protein